MDLYINSCLKAAAAAAAASEAVAKKVKTEKDTYGMSKPKPHSAGAGAVNLLDMSHGYKLPIIPGSANAYHTTDFRTKPSYGFNLTNPHCQFMDTTYKSMNDPSFKKYYQQNDIMKTLKKDCYITGNKKKLVEKQRKGMHDHHAYDRATKLQQCLLKERKNTSPEQDHFLRCRHLQMIREQRENSIGRRNALQMKEEYLNNIRRQRNLQINEAWKAKEMERLTKIMEEACRQAKVEEHQRKIREDVNQKKHEMVEKRIAYHLKQMKLIDDAGKPVEGIVKNTRQDETGHRQRKKKTSFCDQSLLPHLEQKPEGVRHSFDSANKEQTYYEDCPPKVTSEELRSIIRDTVSWVVARVTTILYPAVTNYEEKLRNNLYPISSSSSTLASSSRCTSSCSEILIHNPRQEEVYSRIYSSKPMEQEIRSLGKTDLFTATKKDTQFTLDKTEQINVKPLQIEEIKSSTEALSSMHDDMDFSSFNVDDLLAFTSTKSKVLDPSAQVTEENLAHLDPDSYNIEYTSLFQRKSLFDTGNSPSAISDPVASTSQHMPEVTKKESSVPSRTLLRPLANGSKPSLNFDQNKN